MGRRVSSGMGVSFEFKMPLWQLAGVGSHADTFVMFAIYPLLFVCGYAGGARDPSARMHLVQFLQHSIDSQAQAGLLLPSTVFSALLLDSRISYRRPSFRTYICGCLLVPWS